MSPPEIAQSLDWFERISPAERRAFIVGFICALGLVMFLGRVLWKWLSRGLRDEIRDLKGRLADLENDNASLRATNGDLQHRAAGGEGLHKKLQAELATLTADWEGVKVEKVRLQQQLQRWEAIGQKLDGLSGSLWFNQSVPADAPPFVATVKRKTRIVSVFNLKGGVGKTTITANLAAVISRLPSSPRIMLIDADWQGSLTSLCTENESQFRAVVEEGKLLHRLIEPGHPPANPCEILHLVGGTLPNTRLLGADGALSQVEDAVLIRWAAERLTYDPRFVLRKWLHSEAVCSQFDLVLIDCPPRLTAASVAALVASDQLLIPVIPDDVSMSAVTILLNRLREDVSVIAPHLDIAGIIPNLAGRAGDLTAEREAALRALGDDAHNAWGKPVPVLIGEAIRNFTVNEMGQLYPNLSPLQKERFERIARRIYQSPPA